MSGYFEIPSLEALELLARVAGKLFFASMVVLVIVTVAMLAADAIFRWWRRR